jgi:hypothetical protein
VVGNQSFRGRAASIFIMEVSQVVMWIGNVGVGGGFGSVELEDWPLSARDEEDERN